MPIQKRSKTLIFIFLTISSFYFLWTMGLKEMLYNYWTRSIEISDVGHPKEIHLAKYDAQSYVYGLEMEITGYCDSDIVLLFGPQKGKYQQEVVLKKGSVHYDFSSDWYEDDCFVYFSADEKVRGKLKLNYRFYGSAK